MSAPRYTSRHVRQASLIACLCALAGCGSFENLASSKPTADAGSKDGGTPDGGLPDAGPPDAGPPVTISDAGSVLCGDTPCACSNGLDDDNDGRSDGFDGECTGPYDQDESSFGTGEVKDGNPNCSDCFFDGNPKSTDDGCEIPTSCTTNGTAASATGACETCKPSAMCVDSCLPRTPNGCDCFGCCEVQVGAELLAIRLADSCSLRDLANQTKCPRCVPSSECRNPCGRCELCPGKTEDDLPADCVSYVCDQADLCSSQRPCTGLSYCSQGCCVPIII